MVRSVKKTFKVILAEGVSLDDFTLNTIFTEVEALVNSRRQCATAMTLTILKH